MCKDALPTLTELVQHPWSTKANDRDACLECDSVFIAQLITPLHCPHWRSKHGPACVTKTFSGGQYRLFANHSWATHFFGVVVGVGYQPVSTDQLGCFLTYIGDCYRVRKNIPVLGRIRMSVQKMCLYIYFYVVCFFGHSIHCFHAAECFDRLSPPLRRFWIVTEIYNSKCRAIFLRCLKEITGAPTANTSGTLN